MNGIELCPICGKTMNVILLEGREPEKICSFCVSYHYPEPCKGEGCEICKEITANKDYA
jgi:hypothetical protein